MNLIMHVARGDVRRFAVPMLLWIGIAAAERVMEGVAPMVTRNGPAEELFELGAGLLWLARLGFSAALIALIVQAHPPVGSTAFWMTRPIPPGVLLGSRLLLIGVLFIAVPALLHASLMAVYRVRPGDIALVILERAIVTAVSIVLIMAAAAWTRTFARFVMLCAAALVATVVVVNLLVMTALSSGPSVAAVLSISEGAVALVTRAADQTAAVVAWIAVIGAGILLLNVQYRTRSRRRSILVAIAGGVVACGLAIAWPWPLLQAETAAPAWAADASTVRIEARPETLTLDPIGVRADDTARWYAGKVRAHLTGLPAGWVATVRRERGRLAFDGGREVFSGRSGGTTLPAGPHARHPMHEALQEALGVAVLESTGLFAWPDLPILTARASDLPAPGTVATYRGDFRIDLHRVEIASVLPIEPGATFQDGSFRIVLDDAFIGEGGPRIRLRSSTARSIFQRRERPTYSYYLRNTAVGDAVAGTLRQEYLQGPWPAGFGGRFFWLGSGQGFYASVALIRFPSIGSGRLPASGATPPGSDWRSDVWLKDAELVVIRTVPAGSVDRTIEMTGLTVNVAPQ